MYVKKMCSSGVGGVTFLLNYLENYDCDSDSVNTICVMNVTPKGGK